MGKDQLPGVERYAFPINQPGRGVPFGEQMIDDDMPRAGRQIGVLGVAAVWSSLALPTQPNPERERPPFASRNTQSWWRRTCSA